MFGSLLTKKRNYLIRKRCRLNIYVASAWVSPWDAYDQGPSRSGNGSARWALHPEGEALRRALHNYIVLCLPGKMWNGVELFLQGFLYTL